MRDEEVFFPLIPFTEAHNVRIVLPNGRDIGNSTPYTEADLKAIQGKDKAAQVEFMRRAMPEYAAFLAWYVQHEKIPPFAEDAAGIRTGGITLVGWSAASDWFIPFFAMADAIPEENRVIIEPYVRSLVTLGNLSHSSFLIAI